MSLLDMQNLLDTATEEVANRPDFVSPEPGIYQEVYQSFKEETKEASKDWKDGSVKKGDKYPVVILQYLIEETLEGGNPQAPIKPGSITTEQFILSADNLPAIKQRYAQILGVAQEDLTGGLREIMTVAANTRIKTQYTQRSGSEYTNKKVIESLGTVEE